MRLATALGLTLVLAACAAAGTEGDVATYDALKAATEACTAKGGRLELAKNGDPQVLADWACKRK